MKPYLWKNNGHSYRNNAKRFKVKEEFNATSQLSAINLSNTYFRINVILMVFKVSANIFSRHVFPIHFKFAVNENALKRVMFHN